MSHTMFIGAGKRSGARGGADQFSWEKVKGDKYKDFYLGHSLHTTAKPTFNNRKPNPLWWTKGGGEGGGGSSAAEDEARRRAEIEAIKREEEQLHLEALGLAPKRRKAQANQLDALEIQELTRRGNTERDAYDAERVAGLGFAPAPQHQVDLEGNPLKPQPGTEGQAREDATEAAEMKEGKADHDEEEWEEPRAKKRSREERREERRKKDEKKRKDKKKKERKDKRDHKARDRHSTPDRDDHSRRHRRHHRDSDDKHERSRTHREDAEHGDRERRRHRSRDSRSPKRRRRESTRSPSPKRRTRHDSPSPPRS